MYTLAEKRGVRLLRAFIKWYKGDGIFSKAWGYDLKKGGWYKLTNVKADYAQDKITPKLFKNLKRKIQRDIGLNNELEMNLKFNNKAHIAKIFKKFVPQTFFIKNQTEFLKALEKIKSEKAVLKPIIGSGGFGIKIKKKEKLAKRKLQKNKEYVLQEFIDTSNGIKGLTKNTHDFRIVVINGKPLYSYIRTPRRGGFLANLHQGGSMQNVKISQIPKEALEILKEVDSKLKKFKPRFYTVDVFFGKEKAYLIEVNTMPGMYFNKNERRLQIKVYKKIIDTFRRGAIKSSKKL